MSSSTALLPKDRKKDDHPIFLRVCHSPWLSIGQKALVNLRGLVATYMFVSFLMIIDFELRRNDHGWLTIFEFSNVEYFIQVLYQSIAFIWTFMHLHYPHHGSQTDSCSTRWQRLLSPPRQNSSNRAWFSIFYTAANTFPHVSTFIYWTILIPRRMADNPIDELYGDDWFIRFFVFNKYAVNSLIALIEVFIFSSIKRQEPLWAHNVGLSTISWIYVLWVYIGYIVTDKYAYFFFDHKQVGWEYTITSWFAFAALSSFFFGFIYVLTGLREKLTKSEHKSVGYQQLPQ